MRYRLARSAAMCVHVFKCHRLTEVAKLCILDRAVPAAMHHDVAPQVEAAPVAASARAAIAVAIGAPVDEGRVTVAIWAGKVVADDDRSDQSKNYC